MIVDALVKSQQDCIFISLCVKEEVTTIVNRVPTELELPLSD